MMDETHLDFLSCTITVYVQSVCKSSQQTQGVTLMLDQFWATVFDNGLTVFQRRLHVLYYQTVSVTGALGIVQLYGFRPITRYDLSSWPESLFSTY